MRLEGHLYVCNWKYCLKLPGLERAMAACDSGWISTKQKRLIRLKGMIAFLKIPGAIFALLS
jgi:hypothetical protein